MEKKLSVLDTTFAGIGIIIGAGIYILIGNAAAYARDGLWISLILSGIIAFITGLSYAELSSIYDEDSGEYAYIGHVFGKKYAFMAGYLIYLAGVIGASAVALGFAGYLTSLVPFGLIPVALAAIAIFTIINLLGIKGSLRLNMVLTSMSILGLLIIIALSAPHMKGIQVTDLPIKGIFKGASLIFFAYIGFDTIVKLAEETDNPRKNIPLSLLIAIGVSTLIYIGVGLAALSMLGWKELSSTTAPLSLVASRAITNNTMLQANSIIAWIAVLSTGNTVLMLLVTMSRMLYGMSKDFRGLRFLTGLWNHTPYNSVLITSGIAVTFTLVGKIHLVAEMTNFAVFTVFAWVNIAVIRSRYIRHRKEMFHEPFNIGKFPILPLIGAASMIFMIINLEPMIIGLGTLLVASGALFSKFMPK